MIKGHVQIDLHNHKSGSKERIEQDNLVTNAVGRVCDFIVGRGLGYNNNDPKIFPLIRKALGGLLIFEDPLTESATNMRFPHDNFITGYAGQSLNTDDLERGSLNANESGPVENGYCTVWDFATSQANGQVSSLALTHCDVDTNGPIWANCVKGGNQYNISYGTYRYNSINYQNNYLYFVDTNANKLRRFYFPSTNYLVTDIANYLGQDEDVASNVFASSDKRWIDGGNGKYYSLKSCVYNAGSSSPNDPRRFTITIESVLASSNADQGEYIIQLDNAHNQSIELAANQFYTGNNTIGQEFFSGAVMICDGIMYLKRNMIDDSAAKIYSFDMNTNSPGTYYLIDDENDNLLCTIPLVDEIVSGYEITTYCYALYRGTNATCIMPIYLRYLNSSSQWVEACRLYVIKSDGSYKAYSRLLSSTMSNHYKCSLFAKNNDIVNFDTLLNNYYMYIPANYLGTICNLESSFEKTNTTSMKVKYTLTNV